MARPSILSTLPDDVRNELNDKLRAAGYGDLIAITEWITAKGYATSKSSLHRYSSALESTDRVAGRQVAQIRQAIRSGAQTPSVADGRSGEILLELGRIKVYEHTLLQELMGIASMDGIPDRPDIPA